MVRLWHTQATQPSSLLNEEKAEATSDVDENGQQDIFNDQAGFWPWVKRGYNKQK